MLVCVGVFVEVAIGRGVLVLVGASVAVGVCVDVCDDIRSYV